MSVEVVCAAFSPADDHALAALHVPGQRATNHRPHLTLTAARSDLAAVAAGVASRHSPIPLVLDHVGTFGSVLWLGPQPSDELRAMQRDAHESLVAAGMTPAFDNAHPDQWVAHCTLARRVTPREAAEFAEQYEPIAVTVTALATILVGGRGDLSVTALAN